MKLKKENIKNIGLYIHIPFCIKKCNYCDFNSYSNIDYLKDKYVDCLLKEMSFYKDKLTDIVIDTIFIGGGTPTCLSEKLITKIMEGVYSNFTISNKCEISIESNPGTLSNKVLKILKDIGINRLSIGLQSWHDKELKKLGRIHTVKQFVDNFNAARQQGFNNINIDLMFALPDQDMNMWKDTLDNVIKLNPEHISCYSLIIEKNTKFYRDLNEGKIKLVDDDVDRQMYHYAINFLSDNGYKHYEISNFSKQGFKCRHNMKYWNCKKYLGIGAGAHSYMGEERFNNIISPNDYVEKVAKGNLPIHNHIILNEKDKMAEFMFLGLRLTEGINSNEFERRFNQKLNNVYKKQISKFLKLGLMQRNEDVYKLTTKGIDISNRIFVEFI